MGWKKLVSICLFLVFIGCISFYHHPKGGFRPKKPNFSLAKEKFVFNNLIDTMAIYIKNDTFKYGNKKSTFFLKFYNNGRFFVNDFEIDKSIHKSLFPGFIGYYNLNDNKLDTEYYSVDYFNKRNTKYVKQKGIVKGDTIFFNNQFIKGKKDTYIKQKLDFIPEPSNW